MTIGGELAIHTTTNFIEKKSQTIRIGVEGLGETSTGGGTGRDEIFMIKTISLQKEIMDGGMGSLTRKTFLLTTWTFLLHGFATTKTSPASGEEIRQCRSG